MVYGYADNDNDKQLKNVDQMYYDCVSFSERKRPQLDVLKNVLQSGDTLVVRKLCQLGCSTRTVLQMLIKMLKNKINIIAIDDEFDTNNPITRATLYVLRDVELHLFKQVRANTWKNAGAKPKEIDMQLWNAYYTLWKNKSITQKQWMVAMDIPYSTFYRRLKKCK